MEIFDGAVRVNCRCSLRQREAGRPPSIREGLKVKCLHSTGRPLSMYGENLIIHPRHRRVAYTASKLNVVCMC